LTLLEFVYSLETLSMIVMTFQTGRWVLVLLLSQLFGLLAGCNGSVRHDDAADITAIKAMSAARAKAFNEGDAAAIAIHFTERGVLMAPGAEATSGREAVERYYQSIFDEYVTTLESGYVDVKVSGDLAYGQGYARVGLVPHGGGDTLVSTAKYINILERQADGTWLTTHDIWNGNE
jgi:uncharacterized protein (TIGR02246 family)